MEYYKKAKGKIIFHCTDGEAIHRALEKSRMDNMPQTIELVSKGLNDAGDLVATACVTWSLKMKTNN